MANARLFGGVNHDRQSHLDRHDDLIGHHPTGLNVSRAP